MDYEKHYNKLIERARNRVLDCYTENHHIVPRCMGGSDDVENLVALTPEEHYVAHQLLVKMYPGEPGLVYAVKRMTDWSKMNPRPKNKLYGWVRNKFAVTISANQTGIGNSQYGTFWVTNGYENRKIRCESEIPEGWQKGYKCFHRDGNLNPAKDPNVVILGIKDVSFGKTSCKEDIVSRYEHYYQIYKEVGFEKFKKIVGYTKSKPNLVKLFSKHVKEFVPQNGKKRGI